MDYEHWLKLNSLLKLSIHQPSAVFFLQKLIVENFSFLVLQNNKQVHITVLSRSTPSGIYIRQLRHSSVTIPLPYRVQFKLKSNYVGVTLPILYGTRFN